MTIYKYKLKLEDLNCYLPTEYRFVEVGSDEDYFLQKEIFPFIYIKKSPVTLICTKEIEIFHEINSVHYELKFDEGNSKEVQLVADDMDDLLPDWIQVCILNVNPLYREGI